MIVNSERALALTCPACQVVQAHEFSLFRLSRPLQLTCGCGFSQGHFRKLNKNYELDVLGIDGNRIRLLFSKRELFHKHLVNVLSPKNGQKLGYLGYPQIVKETVCSDAVRHATDAVRHAPDAERHAPDVGNFSNSQIMREVLDRLQDLAEQRKIRCECERPSVGLDVYTDRVELVCSFCGSTVLIGASIREHADRLSRVSEIIMQPRSAGYLEEWLRPLN